MHNKWRIVALATAVLVPLVGSTVVFVYRSVNQVPAFYQAMIAQNSDRQELASDECLRQVAALASDFRRAGRWQAVFTAEQINGWLAVDLVRNYPDALPATIENPRVSLEDGAATLAYTNRSHDRTTVVSMSFDLYLSQPNEIALRIRRVRAGLMPVPLTGVLEAISAAAAKLELELQWRQIHGDPVALVKLSPADDASHEELELEAVEVRAGAVYLSGHTSRDPDRPLALSTAPHAATVEEPAAVQARAELDENETSQR